MHELDRYNGRHTEIDIISFVRSNDFANTKQSVGFLAEEIVDLKMVGSVFGIISIFNLLHKQYKVILKTVR